MSYHTTSYAMVRTVICLSGLQFNSIFTWQEFSKCAAQEIGNLIYEINISMLKVDIWYCAFTQWNIR